MGLFLRCLACRPEAVDRYKIRGVPIVYFSADFATLLFLLAGLLAVFLY